LGRALDDEGLHRRLGRVLAGDVGEVVETFRRERGARGEPTAPGDLWFAIETDRFFRAPVLRDADAHAAHDDTWVYLFDWCSPGMRGWLGACHALEIAFVFGTQGRAGLARFTGSGEAADALSRHMIDAWSGFARTGSPSTDALDWPRHDPATRPTAILGPAPHVEQAPRDAERAVVDRHLRDPWT
jgi:para-nitrobenzyl esterase